MPPVPFQVEPLSGPEFGNTLVSLRSAGLPRWVQTSSGLHETCERSIDIHYSHYSLVSKFLRNCFSFRYRLLELYSSRTCQTPLPGCPNLELTEHQVLVREYPSAALHGHSKRGALASLSDQMVNFSLNGHEFSFTWTRREINPLSYCNRPLALLPPLISLAWWSTAVMFFDFLEK